MAAQDIIIKPILSEKSYSGIQDKKYTFVVDKKANKTEIKLAFTGHSATVNSSSFNSFWH